MPRFAACGAIAPNANDRYKRQVFEQEHGERRPAHGCMGSHEGQHDRGRRQREGEAQTGGRGEALTGQVKSGGDQHCRNEQLCSTHSKQEAAHAP